MPKIADQCQSSDFIIKMIKTSPTAILQAYLHTTTNDDVTVFKQNVGKLSDKSKTKYKNKQQYECG